MTLEPRGYSPLIGQRPARINRSAADIFRRTSIRSPTARSAQSSEKISPALAMEILRRRHSGRLMWLRPALVVTMSWREGRWRRMSAVMGVLPEQRTALTEAAWVARNSAVGSGDSQALRKWNFWEN